MVIDAIVGMFKTLLLGVLNLLPTTPAPPDLAEMIDGPMAAIGGAIAFVDDWFPFTELVACLGIIVGWMVVVHGFRLAAWLLALIHVGGTDA